MKVQESPCFLDKTVPLNSAAVNFLKCHSQEEVDSGGTWYTHGGIINNSHFAWLSSGPRLEVIDMRTGRKTGAWTFSSSHIKCVIDIPGGKGNLPLLLIGLQQEPFGGTVCVFDPWCSRILEMIRIPEYVTCLALVDNGRDCSLPGVLRSLDGVAAVGTHSGRILIIDLCLSSLEENIREETELLEVPLKEISQLEKYKELTLKSGEHLCLQLNESCTSGAQFSMKNPQGQQQLRAAKDEVEVSALLYCPQLGSLLAGYNFGAFQLYDLLSVRLEYSSSVFEDYAPVTHFALQEPCDDPKAFCYIWVVYGGSEVGEKGFPSAIMYSLAYETKEHLEGYGVLYQDFSTCAARFFTELTALPGCLGAIGGTCISLRSHSRGHGEDTLAICTVSWTVWGSSSGTESFLCIFDLNQWYKEEMPEGPRKDGGDCISFARLTSLVGSGCLLDVAITPSSLSPFKSISRLEEHFLPSALAFRCECLRENAIIFVESRGVQRHLLYLLEQGGPLALARPRDFFLECLHAGLLSQEVTDTISEEAQREAILTMALEQRLAAWLCRCASDWATGARTSVGCSPQLLPDWGWKRASALKQAADEACAPLFNKLGRRPDANALSVLTSSARQLHHLSAAFSAAVSISALPESEAAAVLKKRNAIESACAYLEAVQWLLNVGLLPETDTLRGTPSRSEDGHLSVPYPASSLRRYYEERRSDLQSLGAEGELLFIDRLVGERLRQEWGGAYPPPSIQALLRSYLLDEPDAHSVLVYLFLDLAAALDDEPFKPLVAHLIKFPTVFGLGPGAIRITQAFWQLDHADFSMAVAQLLDPLLAPADLKPWHHELALEALLAQGQHQHALLYQQVRRPPSHSPQHLRLSLTLLALNDMPHEAFHLQRRRRAPPEEERLLRHLIFVCHKTGNLNRLLRLPLDALEEKALVEYLRGLGDSTADDRLAVYYLQRARFAEARALRPTLVSPFRSLILTGMGRSLPPLSDDNFAPAAEHPPEVRSIIYPEGSPPAKKARLSSPSMDLSALLETPPVTPAGKIYEDNITEDVPESPQSILKLTPRKSLLSNPRPAVHFTDEKLSIPPKQPSPSRKRPRETSTPQESPFPKISARKSLSRQVLEQNTLKALSSALHPPESPIPKAKRIYQTSFVKKTTSITKKLGESDCQESYVSENFSSATTTEIDPETSMSTVKCNFNETLEMSDIKLTEIQDDEEEQGLDSSVSAQVKTQSDNVRKLVKEPQKSIDSIRHVKSLGANLDPAVSVQIIRRTLSEAFDKSDRAPILSPSLDDSFFRNYFNTDTCNNTALSTSDISTEDVILDGNKTTDVPSEIIESQHEPDKIKTSFELQDSFEEEQDENRTAVLSSSLEVSLHETNQLEESEESEEEKSHLQLDDDKEKCNVQLQREHEDYSFEQMEVDEEEEMAPLYLEESFENQDDNVSNKSTDGGSIEDPNEIDVDEQNSVSSKSTNADSKDEQDDSSISNKSTDDGSTENSDEISKQTSTESSNLDTEDASTQSLVGDDGDRESVIFISDNEEEDIDIKSINEDEMDDEEDETSIEDQLNDGFLNENQFQNELHSESNQDEQKSLSENQSEDQQSEENFVVVNKEDGIFKDQQSNDTDILNIDIRESVSPIIEHFDITQTKQKTVVAALENTAKDLQIPMEIENTADNQQPIVSEIPFDLSANVDLSKAHVTLKPVTRRRSRSVDVSPITSISKIRSARSSSLEMLEEKTIDVNILPVLLEETSAENVEQNKESKIFIETEIPPRKLTRASSKTKVVEMDVSEIKQDSQQIKQKSIKEIQDKNKVSVECTQEKIIKTDFVGNIGLVQESGDADTDKSTQNLELTIEKYTSRSKKNLEKESIPAESEISIIKSVHDFSKAKCVGKHPSDSETQIDKSVSTLSKAKEVEEKEKIVRKSTRASSKIKEISEKDLAEAGTSTRSTRASSKLKEISDQDLMKIETSVQNSIRASSATREIVKTKRRGASVEPETLREATDRYVCKPRKINKIQTILHDVSTKTAVDTEIPTEESTKPVKIRGRKPSDTDQSLESTIDVAEQKISSEDEQFIEKIAEPLLIKRGRKPSQNETLIEVPVESPITRRGRRSMTPSVDESAEFVTTRRGRRSVTPSVEESAEFITTRRSRRSMTPSVEESTEFDATRRGRRSMTPSIVDEPATSVVIKKSRESKKSNVSPVKDQELLQESSISDIQKYSETHRLTRNQKQLMEKSMEIFQNRKKDTVQVDLSTSSDTISKTVEDSPRDMSPASSSSTILTRSSAKVKHSLGQEFETPRERRLSTASDSAQDSPSGRYRRASFSKAQQALITPTKRRKRSDSEGTDASDYSASSAQRKPDNLTRQILLTPKRSRKRSNSEETDTSDYSVSSAIIIPKETSPETKDRNIRHKSLSPSLLKSKPTLKGRKKSSRASILPKIELSKISEESTLVTENTQSEISNESTEQNKRSTRSSTKNMLTNKPKSIEIKKKSR